MRTFKAFLWGITIVVRYPRQLLLLLVGIAVSLVGVVLTLAIYPWRPLLRRLSSGGGGEVQPIYALDRVQSIALLRGGEESLLKHIDYLNRINVFPVADGDTGNNMRHTIEGAADAMSAVRPDQAYAALEAHLMLSARGNSGMILSQYLIGFMGELWADEVEARRLEIAFRQGYERAYAALDEPAAGTVLDVMKAANLAVHAERRASQNLIDLVEAAVAAARDALEQTQFTHPVLRKAKVVDSGGAGYLYLLVGFLGVLKQRHLAVAEGDAQQGFVITEASELTYRYCTEGVIRLQGGVEQNTLRGQLRQLGDSLQMVVVGGRLKVHVHSDQPEEVKHLLAAQGTIEDWKVDDMAEMQTHHLGQLLHGHGRTQVPRVGIVTDSSLDLPDEWAIPVPHWQVPLEITAGTLDAEALQAMDLDEFYAKMRHDKRFRPQTSMPAPAQAQQILRLASEQTEALLCLTLSDRLSGTHQLLRQTIEQQGLSATHCLDSQVASTGLTLLVEAAAEAIERGDSLPSVIEQVVRQREQVRVYFLVEHLRYLQRGGRVSRLQSWLGNLLGIQPLLALVHGEVKPSGEKLLFPQSADRVRLLLAPLLKACEEVEPPRRVYIMQADARKEAELLQAAVREQTGLIAPITKLNRVLGAHTGPGTLGIAFL